MGFCGLWLGGLGSGGWVFGDWGVVDGFNVRTLIINLLTVITTFDQSNCSVDYQCCTRICVPSLCRKATSTVIQLYSNLYK